VVRLSVIVVLLNAVLIVGLILLFAKLSRSNRSWYPRWSTSASSTLTLDSSVQDARHLVRRALLDLAGANDVVLADDGSTLEARVHRYGAGGSTTLVRIALSVAGSRATVVTLDVRPNFPALYDWGTSRRILRSVVDAIEAAAAVDRTPLTSDPNIGW